MSVATLSTHLLLLPRPLIRLPGLVDSGVMPAPYHCRYMRA